MLSTPDLSDLNPGAQALPFQFQRFGCKVSCQGPIATVACFEDNSRVKEAVLSQVIASAIGKREWPRRALTGDLVARAPWRMAGRAWSLSALFATRK